MPCNFLLSSDPSLAALLRPYQHCDASSPPERLVGITEFLPCAGDPSPVSLTLKYQPQDFAVYEIAPNGTILTGQADATQADIDSTLPAAVAFDPLSLTQRFVGSLPDSSILSRFLVSSELSDLSSWLASEMDRFSAWQLDRRAARPEIRELVFPRSVEWSKEDRKAFHSAIKEHFPFLISDTLEQQNKKSKPENAANAIAGKPVRIRFVCFCPRASRDNRGFDPWPAPGRSYLTFHLWKSNIGTMEAIAELASALRVSQKSFGFAGVKDRRAETCQRISAFKVTAERLKSVLKQRSHCMRVSNLAYETLGVQLGDLIGNRFKLVLRNMPASSDIEQLLVSRLNSLSSRGFINYFGLQRFGNGRIPNHVVGKFLIQSRWREAVSLMLMPRGATEREDVAEVRAMLMNTRDLDQAQRRLPPFMRAEKTLLRTLIEQGDNSFANAIQSLPRSLRMMFGHALQSYIWNCMASARLREGGMDGPIVGDLVASDEKQAERIELENAKQELISESEHADNEDLPGAACDVSSSSASVRVLTESDISSGRFTLADVLLPLPGINVLYPEHFLRQRYLECFASLELSEADLHSSKLSEFHMKGSYRKLICKPTQLNYRFEMPKELTAGSADAESPAASLVLEFNLPSSSYATMLVRDLTRSAFITPTQRRDEGKRQEWLSNHRGKHSTEQEGSDTAKESTSTGHSQSNQPSAASG